MKTIVGFGGGMSISNDISVCPVPTLLGLLKSAGFDWVRVDLDAKSFAKNRAMSTGAGVDWTRFDAQCDRILAAGLGLFLILNYGSASQATGMNDWNSPSAAGFTANKISSADAPYLRDFYVTVVGRLYQRGFSDENLMIQMWNEPSSDSGGGNTSSSNSSSLPTLLYTWDSGTRAFINLAAPAIRSAFPNAYMISPTFREFDWDGTFQAIASDAIFVTDLRDEIIGTGTVGPSYVYDAHWSAYDAISFHLYDKRNDTFPFVGPKECGERFAKKLVLARKNLARFAQLASKAIFVDETGANYTNLDLHPPGQQYPQSIGGRYTRGDEAYVAECGAAIWAKALSQPDVEGVGWFTAYNTDTAFDARRNIANQGLIDGSFRPRKIYQAIAAANGKVVSDSIVRAPAKIPA